MGKQKDPFKVDFKSGENLDKIATADGCKAEVTSYEENGTQNTVIDISPATEKPLTKKELRKKKRRDKQLKRIAERKFEREAGLLGVKRASMALGIIGFIVSIIPILVYIGVTLLLVFLGLVTAVLVMLFLVGLLFVIPFILSSGGSIEDYFAIATAPANFAMELFNTVTGIQGVFSVTFAAAGVIMEIIAAVLLFVSYKALCKRNRIIRTVLLSLAFVVSAIILLISLANFPIV